VSVLGFVRDVFRRTTDSEGASRYDTDYPWITWRFLDTDARTRITGLSRIACTCAVCGRTERIALRIPRFGPIPAPPGGKHLERLRFIARHFHADRPHPMAWAKPLLNVSAHEGGLDLDLLAMRLEADLRAHGDAA
jgi:hypothetical protein